MDDIERLRKLSEPTQEEHSKVRVPMQSFTPEPELKIFYNVLYVSHSRLLCPWNSPGKNTAVGCHVFPQGIFLTQGSNPGLLHYRQIL